MELQELFEKALGLGSPWQVAALEFSPDKRRPGITIDFPRGSTFACPVCGATDAKAYDTDQEEWRHLNFFQYVAYLHARAPRVKCLHGCGIKKITVPWARPGSGFTMLFEALIMALVREMPVAAVAKLVGEHDTRLWRIIHHYVEQARSNLDFSQVSRMGGKEPSNGVDETASRRGHNYVSLFFNADDKRVLFGTALNIPKRYEILLLLAIGKPAETVAIEPLRTDGDTGYWRDSQEVHHVPKRSLDEIIVGNT